jgi:translin
MTVEPNAAIQGGPSLANLEPIAARIHADFAARNAARDKALGQARELTRHCSLATRAVHRGDFPAADAVLAAAWQLVQSLECDLAPFPDLYYTGYVQDALKEYAEARTVRALVRAEPLPEPEALHVPYAAYLNGLAEAIGELRRFLLDSLRRGDDDHCEDVLAAMDEIYTVLVTMDFPDALTSNLRRSTDVARSIIEKTRGDLTYALQQRALQASLRDFERRISAEPRA